MSVHAIRPDEEPDPAADPIPTVAALSAMSPGEFNALVAGSLGKETAPEVWDALTDPAVMPRTRNTLGSLHANVLAQLAVRNSELDELRAEGFQLGTEGRQQYLAARDEQAEWRRRATYWRKMVEARMALVKSRTKRGPRQLSMPYGPGSTQAARKHNRVALEQLGRAIAEHKRIVTSGDGDETDDDALWACLETVTAITATGDEVPLGEWMEHLDELREREAEG